eukprot:CAMPEP_0183795750 /NCGR_PEP_ID=MMETSP0803_2-20130417/5294_1 /TAXON_ID=195967 /ORGANISM="Crustomastix stigmata, Strain CCMP3273" /LENGTH=304 /DNA_ID=CAMNT_0026040237 /DNA_START=516 /DNA_END=1430 /DNA_ORIENTATION=+
MRFFNTNKVAQKVFVDTLGVKTPRTLQVSAASSIVEDDIEIPTCDFVLKPTNSFKSIGLFIKKGDTEIIRKKQFDWQAIREKIKEYFFTGQVVKDYVFEELLIGEDGTCPPPLYKFFVMGDKILKILYIGQFDTQKGKADLACIDENYAQQELTWVHSKPYTNLNCAPPARPMCWEEMIIAVKQVGKEMKMFTRVDFFATSRGAVFGEFSFGWAPSDWTPECSKDLCAFYDELPATMKDLMIPNPWTPAVSPTFKAVKENPFNYVYLTDKNILLAMLITVPVAGLWSWMHYRETVWNHATGYFT